ncbi:MAG: hypothetical protein ABI140_03295 [Jatrophihabitantaceae bacterium]
MQLDLENYRIPVRPDDQAAAMEHLFNSEKVMDQARMILRDGYFDNEVPIVVEEGGRYVALEGNRRLSALKALRDPTVVPSHEQAVRALLKRRAVEAENLPESIRVFIVPSRDLARPHVARLHTTRSKKPWGRDEQANYYYSLLSGRRTVADLKEEFRGVQVVRFIKMAVMRRFLQGVQFHDGSLHEYVSGPGLTMSVFEYAYRHVSIAEAMGAFFEDDGQLRPKTKVSEKIGAGLTKRQRDAVEYLMTQFRAGDLNTRSAAFRKDTPENTDLINRLWGRTPGGSAGGSADDDSGAPPGDDSSETGGGGADGPGHGAGAAGSNNEGGDNAGGRGPNHPDTKDKLDLAGLDYWTHTSTNLQLRYQELRRLSLGEFPIAAAVLLRTVLETTIKFHFEAAAVPVTGELSQVFKLVASTYGKEKALRQPIGRIESGQASTQGSIQWFNLAAHSADVVITAQDVREAFRTVHPVLRRLLRPPASSAS